MFVNPGGRTLAPHKNFVIASCALALVAAFPQSGSTLLLYYYIGWSVWRVGHVFWVRLNRDWVALLNEFRSPDKCLPAPPHTYIEPISIYNSFGVLLLLVISLPFEWGDNISLLMIAAMIIMLPILLWAILNDLVRLLHSSN